MKGASAGAPTYSRHYRPDWPRFPAVLRTEPAARHPTGPDGRYDRQARRGRADRQSPRWRSSQRNADGGNGDLGHGEEFARRHQTRRFCRVRRRQGRRRQDSRSRSSHLSRGVARDGRGPASLGGQARGRDDKRHGRHRHPDPGGQRHSRDLQGGRIRIHRRSRRPGIDLCRRRSRLSRARVGGLRHRNIKKPRTTG